MKTASTRPTNPPMVGPMCNLYSMTRNKEAILRLFRISPNRAAAFAPLDAIFPGYSAPVVRHADDGERELVIMSWGFVLPQKGKAPRRVTNVRDDTITTSNFWRGSFEQRNGLVAGREMWAAPPKVSALRAPSSDADR